MKLSAGIARAPPRPVTRDRGAERREHQRPVGRRIGMRQAAADGAAIAHRTVGDAARHLEAARRRQRPAILDLGMGDGGADAP